MKFSHLYEELKFDDVFPVASDEEAATRKEQYTEIRLKEAFDVYKTKLPDGTWHVHDTLDVSECGLTSLKDLNVSIVDINFYCFDNKLTNLEGCPKEIKGSFSCSNNTLTSLKGCPATINGTFYCHNTKITSLEGCPTEVKGDFYCYDNLKKFTKDEIRAICNVTGYVHV